MPINPAFHRHPDEALLIGRIVAAFGELEYQFIHCAGLSVVARNNPDYSILRALYRLRSTSSRIEAADAMMRAAFKVISLEAEYGVMFRSVRHCLKIRNQ